MRRGGGGRDDFFGDPFGNPFGNSPFGNNPFGNIPFGGGRPGGSLLSNIFGGQDPFDDPFFTQPFGGMMRPGMLGPGLFGSNGSPFGGFGGNAGFLEQQRAPLPPEPSQNRSQGPIIRELGSDDEEEEEEGEKGAEEERKDNPRKHSRPSKAPYVQDPDDEVEEKKSRRIQPRSEFNMATASQPQNRSFSFQSSSVTYGGSNGAYYTASTTRRMGGDGVVMEESKEADTATGKAAHRVSRGIRDKGHSLTRKLDSDGRVDSVETLHNLNEDELPVFDEAWRGKAQQHLPGWNRGLEVLGDGSNAGRNTGSGRHFQHQQGQFALPSTEQPHSSARVRSQSRNGSSSKRA